MLAKNQKCILQIESMNDLGFGVARDEGKVVFVSGAVAGETVEAVVIKVNRSYAVAKAQKIVTPSPYRCPSPCTARGCGGCAYKEITYEREREIKREDVRQAFRKAGLPHVQVREVQGTGQPLHYRNKAQYAVKQDKDGRYHIGFYAPKSHRVTDAEDCPLQPRLFAAILKTLRTFLEKSRLSAYDEEKGTGVIRHVYLRSAENCREVLFTLVINAEALPASDELVEMLRAKHPEIVGILLNVNRENTNVVCGDTYIPLWGREYLTDTLADVRLQIAPASFYQVNRDAAELLYRRAAELAELRGDETVLDLFCGAGSIGLSMAHRAGEIVGVEIVPEAVACARENAALNGIRNAFFYCGDATETEELLALAEKERGEKIRPDVIVLDPPRKGCTERLLSYVSGLGASRIIYVSCNPDTLARDAAILRQYGWECDEVTPLDLFPRTGHVETIVCFNKQ